MSTLFTALFERPLKNETLLQNRYKITKFVGRGSYGMVYLALDQVTARMVIVKQHRERIGKNSKEMLQSEAAILSFLNHPAIPKYLELFPEDQKSFLIMEYIEGSNFEDLVLNEGRGYDEKESLQILLEVLQVVSYLHKNKIIHRDLRLPNIITKDNQVFIIDFGLAVCSDNNDGSSTKKKKISPEKELFREKSYKSDFYALGHFLLFLLYSEFEPTSKKEQSWEEELQISNDTKKIIKRLLQLEETYEDNSEIIQDVEGALLGACHR